MEDPRPDVRLDIEDIRQILEHFGYEVTQENINAIIRAKTTVLAVGIRTTLEGNIAPEMEANLKRSIASRLVE